MAHRPLKLAIVGGGIGGLSLALSLHKLIPDYERFLHIDIYESTGSLKAQVGAGVGQSPFTWGILEELGLVEELYKYTLRRQTNEPVSMFQLRQGDQILGRNLCRMSSDSGRSVGFHRGDFQAVFLNKIPDSVVIHTKKRLSSYTQDDIGVVLSLEDGTTAKADILIGADGLQSRVRRRLVEEVDDVSTDGKGLHPADARWSGVLTYRTLVSKEKLVEQGFPNHRGLYDWSLYMGKGAALMCYPVSNGSSVNFVGFRFFPEYEGTRFNEETVTKILRDEGYVRPKTVETKAVPVHKNVDTGDVWSENSTGLTADGKRTRWFTRVTPEEVKHLYRGWEPEVQALVNSVESPICWAVHTAPKLKSFAHKRVGILGDAAHAMHPHHGTGGGSAICDSYVLAHLFAAAIATDPSKLGLKIGEILDIYDKVRRSPAQEIAAATRACAYHYSGMIQEGTPEKEVWTSIDTTTEEGVKRLHHHLTTGWSYAWDKSSVPESVKKAVGMLRERY